MPRFSDPVIRDTKWLHPLARAALEQAIIAAQSVAPVEAYETYRSPARQLELLTAPKPTTRAAPWHSAHQYGMAVDLALKVNGQWSWDISDTTIAAIQSAVLSAVPNVHFPIKWDPLHCEWEGFKYISQMQ